MADRASSRTHLSSSKGIANAVPFFVVLTSPWRLTSVLWRMDARRVTPGFMCGIIGYLGTRSAAPLIMEGLAKLEYRGYDSAGVAILQNKDGVPITHRVRAAGKISKLVTALKESPTNGSHGIGHTRWATHGGPTEGNAHPHFSDGVSVVHNGIIENHAALRVGLLADGFKFLSETDTEVIAHLVARALKDRPNLHEAVQASVAQMQGAWALCVISERHPGEIVVARDASPLIIGLHDSDTSGQTAPEVFVASDVSAILNHTRTVLDLNDGDVATLTIDKIRVTAADLSEAKRRTRRVTWSPVSAEKHGYKHFMLKEIHEQPTAIRDTVLGHVDGNEIFSDRVFPSPGPHGRVILLGCGTSWHAALCGKIMIEQLARVPAEVDLASEFRYRKPVVREGDIAIAVSQSGETADTLAAIREAKRLGAKTLSICNVVDSSIARATDEVLYTHAGPEISVASTKAFTTQLVALSLYSMWLAKRMSHAQSDAEGATGPELLEILTTLRNLPATIESVLEHRALVQNIARRFVQTRDMLYLGRGLGYPVALEGALKLKEISYLHAEGYASGEMKHGPIALIDEKMPVVVIATEGPGYAKVISNLEEVRSRGGKIIAIATMGDTQIDELAEDVIFVPPVHPMLQPIVASVPLQLLAYYIAEQRGNDVDQPRNLAKSVTVE